MTETIFFLALGMVLLAIILAIILLGDHSGQPLPPDGNGGEFSPAIFANLELIVPSRFLAERIFAQEDLDLVAREAPSLKSTFVQERKQVALLWLKDMRSSVDQIFRFYRLVMRSNPAIQFGAELRVARNYLLFLCISYGSQALIHLLGPFHGRGMMTRLFVLATRVSIGVEETLTAMDPSSLVRVRDDWARRQVS